MSNRFAPIALFCYNRLDCLQKTVEALQKNDLAAESELFIFSDGPKADADPTSVARVREYLKTIRGFRSIQINEAPANQGLACSIISGVSAVVRQFGKIIVLEDDLVTSPFFLSFMNEALSFYEYEEKVAGIQGWRPLQRIKMPETFFIREVGCWGWGTWRRGWDLFEQDGQKLLDQFTPALQREFDIYGAYPYYAMLQDQVAGRVDSWAIRWYASVFLKGKLGLQPGHNLVANIGYQSGTHFSSESDMLIDHLAAKKPMVRPIPLQVSERTLRRLYIPYFHRVTRQAPMGALQRMRMHVSGLLLRILPDRWIQFCMKLRQAEK